jgi:hypothetical protein
MNDGELQINHLEQEVTLKIRTKVWITTSFEAFHFWPECPHEEVAFLRNLHRHIFHVKLTKEVTHDDRDIEFIMLKRRVDEYLKGKLREDKYLGRMSCEELAEKLALAFDACEVTVSEDNENGATVSVEKIFQSTYPR